MKLAYHDHFRPCNDVVFAIMFGKRDLFNRLCSAVTKETVEIIGEPHSQATLREDDVLLNTIRFDTFAYSSNNKFYSMDIQRRYKEARQERRTVYYACRTISTQPVKKMEYEKLKPVNISFLLTDCDNEKPVRKVKLCDVETGEVFDDLMELTIVHVPTVLRSGHKADDLYLFASFFMVSSQEDADIFTNEFVYNDLGRELILMYNASVANVANLQQIEKEPYFVERLSEAEIEEVRQEVRQEARLEAARHLLDSARHLLDAGVKPQVIAQSLGLSMDTVRSLGGIN